MADLGNVLGSLMSAVIKARKMADEQTAALAEYYKSQPLLEGLTVPRVRIPELSIDMPLLIESEMSGSESEMKDPSTIANSAFEILKSSLDKYKIKTSSAFRRKFMAVASQNLTARKRSGVNIMPESIARTIQEAFAEAVAEERITLSAENKAEIAHLLRTNVSKIGISKDAVASSIKTNILTTEIKDKSSSNTVMRMKITLKEEGLEWITRKNESGDIERSLQPE